MFARLAVENMFYNPYFKVVEFDHFGKKYCCPAKLHTLQRNPVAVCEDCGLSQLKQINDSVLYMFTGQQ